jgi:hypothetical protein
MIWSRGRELNSRPADYESAALPLSYLGLLLILADLGSVHACSKGLEALEGIAI